MKSFVLPLFACVVSVASLASGATNATYTASADPNLSPDSNGGTADVWTLSHGGDPAGASNNYYGSYYATGNGVLGTAWAIYANHNYTATAGTNGFTSEADQTSVFAGGVLNVGQTVSVDFLANSVDTGQQYGIRMLTGGNGGTFVLALSFIGGDGGYRYYDGSTGGNIPFGYQQNGFNFAFTQTGATTYSVVATPIGGGAPIGQFSGTDSGSPDTIQLYNESAGQDNNVLSNNLAIIPEPGTYAFVLAGGLVLAGLLRRSCRVA